MRIRGVEYRSDVGTILLAVSSLGAGASAITAGSWPRVSRRLLRLSVVGIWSAVALATVALIRTDPRCALDASHTRPALSLIRRVMGLWAGSAGSLLVFTAILSVVLVFAPALKHQRVAPPILVAVLTMACAWVVSPFERLDAPVVEGSGIGPTAEHWTMVVNPPVLYLGLALALVPGLAHPIPTPGWNRAALATLSLAIALATAWHYVELGWSGWWEWDPVANTALVVWMLLLASLRLPNRHHLTQRILLGVWPVVFVGLALSRTSPSPSIHAFAVDDTLRWVLWPISLAAAALAVGIQHRFPTHAPTDRHHLIQVGLLLFAATLVALGTLSLPPLGR